jgi:hypothetical protein
MVGSLKHSKQKQLGDALVFAKSYFVISMIVTIALTILAYKDVIYLKFGSDVLQGSNSSSDNTQRLLLGGLNNNVGHNFSRSLPLIIFTILGILVIYSLINTYQRTHQSLTVSKLYVNAKSIPTSNILLMNIALRSTAFTIPLLYWCFYLVVWFPHLIKIPLQHILDKSILPLIFISVVMIIVTCLLTHVGLVMSRLAARFYRIA